MENKDGIYIGKNKDFDEEKKQPPIYLSYIDSHGNFNNIASCWKTKSGQGYMCRLKDGVEITIRDIEFEGKKEQEEIDF